MEPICENCARSIFCESWGEYKCTLKHIRVRGNEECVEYKSGKGKVKKPCQCKTCLEMRGVEDDV